jgi:hypothetical protein
VPLGAKTSSAAAATSPPRRRVWHPAARTALPPEPGRLQTNALINFARHARGCHTRGDDRLETRAYAVKRLLWRWGQAERSGHYARSIGQLVEGLAPIMGWGPIPARDGTRRRRWLCAHAANVRRWLADLQAAGIISYVGETDNLGMDWRTLITLYHAPAPPPEQLQAAQQRMAAWGRRRRAAARRQRDRQRWRRGRRLEAIRRSSQRPNAAMRRRLAIARSLRCEQPKLRTHHQGSSNYVGALRFLHTSHQPPTSASETGAHARGLPAAGVPQASQTDCTENKGCVTSARAHDDLIEQRVTARAAASSWCRHTAAAQALQRAREIASAAPGRSWPPGRLREAWVVYHYGTAIRDDWLTPHSGPERVGDHGAGDAGTRGRGQEDRAARAIALYEQHADHQPPGWPRAGAAALCVLAALGRADTLEGDIARLLVLAKDMRACTIVHDDERRARMTRRAMARAGTTRGRLSFRSPGPARWETIEQRRLRLRDELLFAGEDPSTWTIAAAIEHRNYRNPRPELVDTDAVDQELDGARSRQLRYTDELRLGRWDLPPRFVVR